MNWYLPWVKSCLGGKVLQGYQVYPDAQWRDWRPRSRPHDWRPRSWPRDWRSRSCCAGRGTGGPGAAALAAGLAAQELLRWPHLREKTDIGGTREKVRDTWGSSWQMEYRRRQTRGIMRLDKHCAGTSGGEFLLLWLLLGRWGTEWEPRGTMQGKQGLL